MQKVPTQEVLKRLVFVCVCLGERIGDVHCDAAFTSDDCGIIIGDDDDDAFYAIR